MDEMPKQLIAETRIPLPACEGHPVLYDYEYERKGVCNLFLFVEPLRGWRERPNMGQMGHFQVDTSERRAELS